MKHVLAIGMLAASLAVLASTLAKAGPDPGALAFQAPGPCTTWNHWSLRGAYAFSALAWQDLSQINPALPQGYAPVTIIGAFKIDGNGDLTGWASVNAGGVQMSAEFVNSKFGAPKADCSFPISLSMKMKEEFGGATMGPYPYVGVIAGDMSALEVVFMMLGSGPGSHVELNHAKRISMNVN